MPTTAPPPPRAAATGECVFRAVGPTKVYPMGEVQAQAPRGVDLEF